MGALALLQTLGNAQNTAAILNQMAEAKQALADATVAHDAAAKEAQDAAAALAGVQAQTADLAAREAALSQAQTSLSVASSANVAQANALDDREAELAKREQEHAAKVKANEDRIASVRASLA